MTSNQTIPPIQTNELSVPNFICKFPCCCCQMSARDSVKTILFVDGLFLSINIIWGLVNRQLGVLAILLYFVMLSSTYYFVDKGKARCIRSLCVIVRYIIYTISILLGIAFIVIGILLLGANNQNLNFPDSDSLVGTVGVLALVTGIVLLVIGAIDLCISRIFHLAMNTCNQQDEINMTQRDGKENPSFEIVTSK
eukprot:TRINITY_DN9707_c0_g1_i1.p1 TRINITY_DN9707_c0_g1~~TRINITY_DN9707_c0_g1_i1.p1  ORF type:complete len:195 (-),score=0.85 TRINITY_DN9707_c0_g1_i1:102-686(-)